MKMNSGKAENANSRPDVKKPRRSRRRKLVFWLAIDAAVAAIVFALLLYRPSIYSPAGTMDYEDGQVSRYLTHDLSPQLYNGAQLGKPFDLVITEEGLNDMISHSDWPKESNGVLLYSPAALIVPGAVVMMATADVRGMEFVITIELSPQITNEGLLSVMVTKVKVGALNITPVAQMVAKRMYTERLAEVAVDTEALTTRIAASLFNQEPFEPVFTVDDRKIRVEAVSTEGKRLVLHIVPAT